ncbi:MAG: SpoIIE family protein phosphatase [Verrucomicrobiae bacterium]|nr:SpoIIE family protein phosphatase [Verrucomicrobiae bacterium]
MHHYLYVGALVCLVLAYVVHLRRKTADLRAALSERQSIVGEEKRLFDFLHGLGESLLEDSSPPNMHRYIVDGVAGVVGADAGILYLLDTERRPTLVPVYLTKRSAAVIPLPPELADLEPGQRTKRARSFLRLTSVPADQGILGLALGERRVVHAPKLVEHPAFGGGPHFLQNDRSALVAPLIYGPKAFGVVAVIKRGGSGFSDNDLDVFASIAEQSAFALGSAIIHAEAGEKRRLEEELERASEIQRVLLPRDPPGLSDYRVAAHYQAARLVSGDYYDYIPVNETHYGVAVGDVCGKGIAASLVMAMCRSLLRSAAPENLSPARVLHGVNRAIFADIREDMFVSLLYLLLEKDSNRIVMARAGHEPCLIYRRATGGIETVEAPGMAAGIDEGDVFERTVEDTTVEMEPGDVLLMFTDGVTESLDRDGEEFGSERLEAALVEGAPGGADQVIDRIRRALSDFSGKTRQHDDITLIAVEKR